VGDLIVADQKVFVSGFFKSKNWRKEIQALAGRLLQGLNERSCDLAVFFISESYKDLDPDEFSRLLTRELRCRVSIGCNASGIIAADEEIEMEPAVSVMAMHLPGVKIYPFNLSPADVESLKTGTDLIQYLDIYPTDKPRFLMLADPSSCDVMKLLEAFNDTFRGLPMIGGLASGGSVGADNWLSLNGQFFSQGAVGLALVGDIEFETIVSQGCRPIAKPFVITKSEGNALYELAGEPAVSVLKNVLECLSPEDRALAQHSLFVGLVMNENQTHFKRGDFLIRNLMGFEPDSGALMIGASLRVGQTLQFQLRDSETSAEDLRLMLEKAAHLPQGASYGGILVSCCGRGKGLYGQPDHDVKMIQSLKGPLPLTGFFANGEIGPIGNKNYVHGYTSSLVILH
jgi:small ligand-binding sensory domain FIST